jgi:hypothetical protein
MLLQIILEASIKILSGDLRSPGEGRGREGGGGGGEMEKDGGKREEGGGGGEEGE